MMEMVKKVLPRAFGLYPHFNHIVWRYLSLGGDRYIPIVLSPSGQWEYH